MVEYDFTVILLAVFFFTVVVLVATHIIANLTRPKSVVPMALVAAATAISAAAKDDEEQDVTDTTGVVGVTGSGEAEGKIEVKIEPHTDRYNVYEDVTTLEELDKKYLKSIKNVVIDGNNFLYFLKEISNGGSKTYMKHLEHAIKKAAAIFPKKAIFFVMKDPNNEQHKKQALEDMGFDENTEYKQAFKEYSEKIIKKFPNVRIVVVYGDSKARDDFGAVYLAELLPKSMLLSRDLYRDVNKTAGTDMEATKFITYGKAHKKIDALVSSKAMPNIGNWSFADKLVGFARIKTGETCVYKTKKGGRVMLIRF
jgi:hypothetical protein